MIKEHPILFSAPMVRAILDGRKTQTRRVVGRAALEGYVPSEILEDWEIRGYHLHKNSDDTWWNFFRCPYGQPGDRLWVRETHCIENTSTYHGYHHMPDDGRPVKVEQDFEQCEYFLIPHYKATESEPHIVPDGLEDPYDDRTRWRPSIHMPRWASRILLEIVSVRVERLQDITEADARSEGLERQHTWMPEYRGSPDLPWRPEFPRDAFADLWASINGWDNWATNPWVWVVEFKQVQQ